VLSPDYSIALKRINGIGLIIGSQARCWALDTQQGFYRCPYEAVFPAFRTPGEWPWLTSARGKVAKVWLCSLRPPDLTLIWH